MKFTLYVLVLFLAFSCAGMSYTQYLNKEGYSKNDSKTIKPYYMKYANEMTGADARNSTFLFDNSKGQTDSKHMRIYCNCINKLGDSCIGPSKNSFSKKEKRLWAKGNAIYLIKKATSGNGYAVTVGSKQVALDPDAC